jgi:hypothetical protein
MNIETGVSNYVKLRDKIKELDDAHKVLMTPYRETLEQLNSMLLDHLNTVGIDNAKTAAGTVYKTEKKSATLTDKELFWNYILLSQNFDLLDYKANVVGVAAFIENNKQLPPGVNWTTRLEVGVRRPA